MKPVADWVATLLQARERRRSASRELIHSIQELLAQSRSTAAGGSIGARADATTLSIRLLAMAERLADDSVRADVKAFAILVPDVRSADGVQWGVVQSSLDEAFERATGALGRLLRSL